jgi:hypothetical protein
MLSQNWEVPIAMTDTTKASSPASRRRRFPPSLLWTLAISGFLLVAFGVAQPFVLRQLGEPQGQDISTADAISILIAVVTILAGGLGVAAFMYAREKVREDAKAEMSRVESESRIGLARAIARVGLNQAALLWTELDPLITKQVLPNSLDWFRRKQIIQGGINVASQTIRYTESLEKTDDVGVGYNSEARVNLAFFLACFVKFVPDEATEEDVAKVFELLPKVDDITQGQPFTRMTADRLQLLESLSWAELCCVDPTKDRWDLARRRVRVLLADAANERALLSPLARARYVATFGPNFFA